MALQDMGEVDTVPQASKYLVWLSGTPGTLDSMYEPCWAS